MNDKLISKAVECYIEKLEEENAHLKKALRRIANTFGSNAKGRTERELLYDILETLTYYGDTKIKTNNTDDDKTFDIVDAFIHLICGRKVRMTHWDKDEYIGLEECKLQIGEKWIIRNNSRVYPAEMLFDKDSIEARWEDYEEES